MAHSTYSLPHLLLLITCWFVLANVCDAQSLWEKRVRTKSLVFEDVKARQVGDLITVVINQNTDVSTNERQSMTKATQENSAAKANYGVSGDLGAGTGGLTGDQSATSNRDFAGDAQFSSERVFSDRFTVRVVDVLPNGNMLVSGRRQVVVEDDVRTLALTGILRAFDIQPDNSIDSRFVSNLQVKYISKGPERTFVQQGWLGRRINKIWPH